MAVRDKMTAKQFNDALRKLDLSVYAAAARLGLSLRQAQRIAGGHAPVPRPVALLLRAYLTHGMPDDER